MNGPNRRLALLLPVLLLAGCGRGGGGLDDAREAAAWSQRLRGSPSERDAALVELRRRREAGVPSLLALLDDSEVARVEGHADIREELVYLLGEAGTTSVEAQRRLVALLANSGTPVGEALSAARGLVLSWRLHREVPILEAYLAVLERVTRPEDARLSTAVGTLALAAGPFPYEPGFVGALRSGAGRPRSCAFCVGALRLYAGRQAEFVDLYRAIGASLEAAPRSDDPAEEAGRLALRETLATAITDADAR